MMGCARSRSPTRRTLGHRRRSNTSTARPRCAWRCSPITRGRSSPRTTARTSASRTASTRTAAASTPARTATRARRTSTSASAPAPTSIARSWSSCTRRRCCARRSARSAGGASVVVFSGVTDCYQPLEASYRLTRGCLEVCAEYANPVGIITKSALIERDIDVLRDAGARRRRARHDQHPVLGPGAGARHRALRRDAGAPPAHDRDAGARRAVGRRQRRADHPGPQRRGHPEDPDRGARRGRDVRGLRAAAAARIGEAGVRGAAARGAAAAAERVLHRIRETRGGQLYDSRFGVRGKGEGTYATAIRSLFDATAARLGLGAARRR